MVFPDLLKAYDVMKHFLLCETASVGYFINPEGMAADFLRTTLDGHNY